MYKMICSSRITGIQGQSPKYDSFAITCKKKINKNRCRFIGDGRSRHVLRTAWKYAGNLDLNFTTKIFLPRFTRPLTQFTLPLPKNSRSAPEASSETALGVRKSLLVSEETNDCRCKVLLVLNDRLLKALLQTFSMIFFHNAQYRSKYVRESQHNKNRCRIIEKKT